MKTKKKTTKKVKQPKKLHEDGEHKINFPEIHRANDLTEKFLDKNFAGCHSRPDAYFGILKQIIERLIWQAPTQHHAMQVVSMALDVNLEKHARNKYFKKAFLINIPD